MIAKVALLLVVVAVAHASLVVPGAWNAGLVAPVRTVVAAPALVGAPIGIAKGVGVVGAGWGAPIGLAAPGVIAGPGLGWGKVIG